MDLNTAKSEYAQMISNASHAFRRAVRNEERGNNEAADTAWRNGIYWQAQSQRENLQRALACHA